MVRSSYFWAPNLTVLPLAQLNSTLFNQKFMCIARKPIYTDKGASIITTIQKFYDRLMSTHGLWSVKQVWDMGNGRVWPIWQGTDSVDTKKYGLWEFMGYHRYGLRQRQLYYNQGHWPTFPVEFNPSSVASYVQCWTYSFSLILNSLLLAHKRQVRTEGDPGT